MNVSLCFRGDFDKLTISFQLHVPLAVFRGKYEMSGKLMNLPISGKGDFNVTMGSYYKH